MLRAMVEWGVRHAGGRVPPGYVATPTAVVPAPAATEAGASRGGGRHAPVVGRRWAHNRRTRSGGCVSVPSAAARRRELRRPGRRHRIGRRASRDAATARRRSVLPVDDDSHQPHRLRPAGRSHPPVARRRRHLAGAARARGVGLVRAAAGRGLAPDLGRHHPRVVLPERLRPGGAGVSQGARPCTPSPRPRANRRLRSPRGRCCWASSPSPSWRCGGPPA